MSPDQINIAIAEYCGLPINICRCGDGPDASIHSVSCEYAHMFSPMADTPDYYHDLNAMHEAEKCLPEDAWIGKICIPYWHRLWQIVREGDGPRDTIHATAAQRAEAFLRTVGKWEDSNIEP